MNIFTIGFEKRKIEEFIASLKDNGIDVMVDIRAVPHSRNRAYAKKNLEVTLSESGIEYILKSELGGPSELRKKVRADGDYEYFFRHYEKLLDERTDCLKELSDLTERKTICLLCYEADPAQCHRSSVANRLKSLNNDFSIIHL